jgi:hypothetical protein
MKKCPGCDSLVSTDDNYCNVCHHDLTNVVPLTDEELELSTGEIVPVTSRKKINWPALAAVVTGASLFVFGFYGLSFKAGIGIFILMIIFMIMGLTIIAITRDVVLGIRYEPGGHMRNFFF